MRPIILAILICMVLLVPVGCKNTTPIDTGKLGQEFHMAVGEEVTFSDTNLKIKFVEVLEDSRCPRDVVCIWAGRVSCLTEITIDNAVYQTVLTASGPVNDYTEEQYRQYMLKFRVEPYPETSIDIKTSDYRLRLIVTETP